MTPESTQAGPDTTARPVRDPMRGMLLRMGVLIAVLLCIAQGITAWLSVAAFEDSVLPEIQKKAHLAGALATRQIEEALALGIPLDRLVGMEAFLGETLARNPDLAYVVVSGQADSATLYAAGNVVDDPGGLGRAGILNLKLPIAVDGLLVGDLNLGIREGSVRAELAELRYDILTVFLTSLIIGIEVLIAFVVVRLTTPINLARRMLATVSAGDFTGRVRMGGGEGTAFSDAYNATLRRINARFSELVDDALDIREQQFERNVQQRIGSLIDGIRKKFRFERDGTSTLEQPRSPMDVRIPFFLFILAQELSRPFLPVFFSEIYEPFAGLSREVAIGLPITGFMLAVLVATPVAGALTDRFSARVVFALGIIPAVLGHIGTAFSTSILEAMFWWMLSGVGFGIIFMVAQVYVARHADAERRTTGMAAFAGAVYAAFVCGPAIGGILVDRIGATQTLLVAAAMAVAAALAAFATIDPGTSGAPVQRSGGVVAWKRLLGNRQFLAISVFSALPARLALAGLFFYLAPLYLTDLGSTQSNIGRIMMVYGVACVVVTPLVARRADRFGQHERLVIIGGIVAGLGCLLPLLGDSVYLVLGVVATLGIGHALLTAPQLAVVDAIARSISREVGLGTSAILGAYRMVERVGAAVGAVLVGALVAWNGYGAAMVVVGVLTLACTAVFTVLYAMPGTRTEAAPA